VTVELRRAIGLVSVGVTLVMANRLEAAPRAEWVQPWCQQNPPLANVGTGSPYPCDGQVAEQACEYMSGYCSLDLEVQDWYQSEGMCAITCWDQP
jgi:hypothetical protein